jgi:hypothetical protein
VEKEEEEEEENYENDFGMKDYWCKFGEVLGCSKLDVEKDVIPVEAFIKQSLLAVSVYRSFYDHYPLILNPNVIWLSIIQGFGTYVENNSEALRSKFVTFEGKKVLLVEREDFKYNSPNNDWGGLVSGFTNQIEKFIGTSTKQLIECDFSNSTVNDRVSSHIALMDVCKNYFSYRSRLAGCGIPYIELLGTVNDWKLIRTKAEALRTFSVETDHHLDNWLKILLPALDHFVTAAEGHPDLFFWGSVCNMYGLSGMKGSPITGWITAFFPYIANGDKFLSSWQSAYDDAKKKGIEKALKECQDRGKNFVGGGIKLEKMPSGMSKAPVHVIWLDVKKEEDLEFYGGLATLYQHPDGALEVRSGWAIVRPREQEDSDDDDC